MAEGLRRAWKPPDPETEKIASRWRQKAEQRQVREAQQEVRQMQERAPSQEYNQQPLPEELQTPALDLGDE